MQITLVHMMLLASPVNKVSGMIWKGEEAQASITIWMVTPESFLVQHEDHVNHNREWFTFDFDGLARWFTLCEYDPNDSNLWHMLT